MWWPSLAGRNVAYFRGKAFFLLGLLSGKWSHLSSCIDGALRMRCFVGRFPHMLTPLERSKRAVRSGPRSHEGPGTIALRRTLNASPWLMASSDPVNSCYWSQPPARKRVQEKVSHHPKVTRLPSAMARTKATD